MNQHYKATGVITDGLGADGRTWVSDATGVSMEIDLRLLAVLAERYQALTGVGAGDVAPVTPSQADHERDAWIRKLVASAVREINAKLEYRYEQRGTVTHSFSHTTPPEVVETVVELYSENWKVGRNGPGEALHQFERLRPPKRSALTTEYPMSETSPEDLFAGLRSFDALPLPKVVTYEEIEAYENLQVRLQERLQLATHIATINLWLFRNATQILQNAAGVAYQCSHSLPHAVTSALIELYSKDGHWEVAQFNGAGAPTTVLRFRKGAVPADETVSKGAYR